MGLESGETENSTARTVLANLTIVFGLTLLFVGVAQVMDVLTFPEYLGSFLTATSLLSLGLLRLTDD